VTLTPVHRQRELDLAELAAGGHGDRAVREVRWRCDTNGLFRGPLWGGSGPSGVMCKPRGSARTGQWPCDQIQ
jgi:hypothetical protein